MEGNEWMAIGQIGFVMKDAWDKDYFYAKFNVVTDEGCCYVAWEANNGAKPKDNPRIWRMIADRGESLYQMMVREGKYKGTEEEFLNEYQQLIQSLQAELDKSKTFLEEAGKKLSQIDQDEQQRVINENRRKENAEQNDKKEKARSENELQRASQEKTREDNEKKRVQEHAQLKASNESALSVLSEQSKKLTEVGNTTQRQGEAAASAATAATNASAKVLKDTETAISQVTETTNNAVREMSTKTNETISDITTRTNTALSDIDNRINPVVASDFKQNEQIKALEGDVADLKQYHGSDFCVGSWDDKQLAPEALEVKGSRDFALAWFPWLVDMTDNAGPVVTKARLLKKNNWFRYADGSFAPAVCVTAEDWALCDAELYLDPGHTQKYCEAGAFDAEAFYNEHGVDTPLYGVDGVAVAHIRRPWETTNKDLSNFIGRKDTIYLCDNLMGRSGKILKGVFGSQTNFDGAQFGQFKLPPTGLSPTPVCTIGGKTRSFFYLMKGESNCQSHSGAGDITHIFDSMNLTFPRVADMNQGTDRKFTRANNADQNSPIPFAEGGFHALNAFLDCMEIAYGTRYLHKEECFSSGISSNDTISSESSWLNRGGVRFRERGSMEWSYAYWAGTPDFCYNSSGKKTNLSESLNYYYPKAAVNEGQIAASYAVERGIPEGQRFELYGSTYYWKSVDGATRLDAGEMNARIYKIVTGTVNAFHPDGTPGIWDVEIVLRIGIIQGMNVSGDIYAYWGGGFEQVGEVTDAEQLNKRFGSNIDLYLQPDQNKWHDESSTSINIGEKFKFEESYIYLGRTKNERTSGALTRMSYGSFPKVFGATSTTAECYYTYCDNYWGSLGQRTRIAARFRGYADLGSCSPRFLFATNSVAYTHRIYAGSAQVLLGAPECNALQAQH